MKKRLRRLLRQVLSPETRRQLKRIGRRLEMGRVRSVLSTSDFELILKDELGLERGDTVLVHASYGRLKTAFAPSVAIEILQGVVGSQGNILMPVYPGNGDEWLLRGEVFDPQFSPISTGVLAEYFVRSEGVRVSAHPIKAVAAWGANRDVLVSEHHLSHTPYDVHSPYGKMLRLPGAKVIGLATFRMSFIHCGEDSVSRYVDRVYTSEAVTGRSRDSTGKVIAVATRVHRSERMRDQPGAMFLRASNCPSCQIINIGARSYYRGEVQGIYAHMRQYAMRQVGEAG